VRLHRLENGRDHETEDRRCGGRDEQGPERFGEKPVSIKGEWPLRVRWRALLVVRPFLLARALVVFILDEVVKVDDLLELGVRPIWSSAAKGQRAKTGSARLKAST